MNRSRHALLRLLLPVAFLLLGCPAPPQSDQVIVSGLGTHIQPGSDVAFLVQLTTAQSYEEAAGRSITVDLLPDGGEGERVFAGETDAGGLVAVSFTAPDVLDAREA
ncbi:MAG: hypothetical protein ACRC1H_12385, partial [Caldilineaceae bacterium]